MGSPEKGVEGTRIMVSATGGMLLHSWWTVRQLLRILQNWGHHAAEMCIILQECSGFRARPAEMT